MVSSRALGILVPSMLIGLCAGVGTAATAGMPIAAHYGVVPGLIAGLGSGAASAALVSLAVARHLHSLVAAAV
ncbi:hypothetical protein ACWELJ_10140 [Nocardia sp. NPDC004582]